MISTLETSPETGRADLELLDLPLELSRDEPLALDARRAVRDLEFERLDFELCVLFGELETELGDSDRVGGLLVLDIVEETLAANPLSPRHRPARRLDLDLQESDILARLGCGLLGQNPLAREVGLKRAQRGPLLLEPAAELRACDGNEDHRRVDDLSRLRKHLGDAASRAHEGRAKRGHDAALNGDVSDEIAPGHRADPDTRGVDGGLGAHPVPNRGEEGEPGDEGEGREGEQDGAAAGPDRALLNGSVHLRLFSNHSLDPLRSKSGAIS